MDPKKNILNTNYNFYDKRKMCKYFVFKLGSFYAFWRIIRLHDIRKMT